MNQSRTDEDEHSKRTAEDDFQAATDQQSTVESNPPRRSSQQISSEFPFESKYVDVYGSLIHYVDIGEGDPVLFLHGNPTSSYLWRNVIPHVRPHARCVAPDLIGMGKSDKPDIAYTYDDHYEYLEAFIDALELEDITLVLHDWGSGLGFRYAHEHQDNVTGIAFMEAIVRPWTWETMPKEFRLPFRLMRTPFVGWVMISVANMFVKRMLPDNVVRELSAEERQRYAEPYPTISSRKPVRVWPREVPINGKPTSVHDTVAAYSEWLTETDLPKLCFYVHPGVLIQADEVERIEREFPETTMVGLGEGTHYVQEDYPHRIGEEIATWFTDRVRSDTRTAEVSIGSTEADS